MSNSLEQLILQMKDTPSTLGWGAILVLGQSQVNSLFQQQYSEAFSDLKFLPPLSGELYLDSEKSIKAQLGAVVLGPIEVLFDFEESSLQSSYLTMRLNIVGGTYTTYQHDVGASEATLIASQRMTAGMGFYVQARISLSQALGYVDKYGIAKLDFMVDDSTRFYSNLEQSEAFQETLGDLFKGFLQSQKNFQFSYELGHLALGEYHLLSPVEFFIRTQKNPSPNQQGTSEGAVVFFVRVKGTKGSPGLPVDDTNFPYFIPDDQVDNKDLYSVALVLNNEFLDFAGDMQLGLLKNLGLGRKHEFAEFQAARSQPCDLLLLGNAKLTAENLTIEPQFLQLKGGQTQQFVVRDGSGELVTEVDWAVSSVLNSTANGTISDSGLYTAFPSSLMDQDLLPTAVTATYKKRVKGFSRKTTAMLLSNFEGVSVAPFVRTTPLGDQPFDLVATSVNGSALTWTLLESSPGQSGLGTLDVISANRASYTPPVPEANVPLVRLQRIRVEDEHGNVAHASIVLLNGKSAFELTPSYTEHISKITGTVQVNVVDNSLYDQGEFKWTVLGQGTITDGLYSAPATLDEGGGVNVITCEIQLKNAATLSSYAIVQPLLRRIAPPPPTWKELDTFTVEAIEPTPTCFANGYQQIPIKITIGTAAVTFENDNGDEESMYIPISDTELASLKIYDKDTGVELGFTDEYQEGISFESDVEWAVNLQRNRFDLMGNTLFAHPSTLVDEGQRVKEVFIHSKFASTRTFAASFMSDKNITFRSEDNGAGQQFVAVTALTPPTPALEHYSFSRVRVFNGEGKEGYSEQDPFGYVLDSIDYWAINYKKQGIYPKAFATLEFLENVSLIRWESDQRDEVFLSYTGYAFYPAPYFDVDDQPIAIIYDSALSVFANRRTTALNTLGSEEEADISPGQLVFTLNRAANIPFLVNIPGLANGDALDNATRGVLNKALQVTLLDVEGNRHRLQIDFSPGTLPDSRNTLVMSLK